MKHIKSMIALSVVFSGIACGMGPEELKKRLMEKCPTYFAEVREEVRKELKIDAALMKEIFNEHAAQLKTNPISSTVLTDKYVTEKDMENLAFRLMGQQGLRVLKEKKKEKRCLGLAAILTTIGVGVLVVVNGILWTKYPQGLPLPENSENSWPSESSSSSL